MHKGFFIPYCSACLFFHPIAADAQDSIDVKGGFFDQREVSHWDLGETSVPGNSKSAPARKPVPASGPTQRELSPPSPERESEAVSGNANRRDASQGNASGVAQSVSEQRKDPAPATLEEKISKAQSLLNRIRDRQVMPPPADLGFSQPTTTGNLALGASVEIVKPPEDNDAVISLVIRSEPEGSFIRALEQLEAVSRLRRAKVGDVYVVGDPKSLAMVGMGPRTFARDLTLAIHPIGLPREKEVEVIQKLSKVNFSEQTIALNNLHVELAQFEDSQSLTRKFGIELSPGWIIEFRSKWYVIEGEYDLSELFTAENTFDPSALR